MINNLYILVQGRHEINIPESKGFIYHGISDPSNYESIEREADEFVKRLDGRELNLVVTGLTQATVAVIKACVNYNKSLVLWHYNQSRGGLEVEKPIEPDIPASMSNYKAQRVL